MFTGLIVEMGEVISFQKKATGARLTLNAFSVAEDARHGDSISINGVCLTVVEKKGNILTFDLSDETLRTTNLGTLKTGDRVNLEPAMRLDSRLGGHIVTGHIDATGRIKSKSVTGNVLKIFIAAERNVTDYLVEKGSVAVDGISLTVVDVSKDGFSIVVIPHTAKLTTIGFKGPGDSVNIEVDILSKYVSKFFERNQDKNSRLMQTLLKEGYV